MEVPARVQEVRGQDHHLAVAEGQVHALVRDRLESIDDQLVDAEVGHEADPELRAPRVGVRGHQPAVHRCDDVRVLMGQEDVTELAPGQERGRRAERLVVDLVSAGIEDHALAAVHDEMLVRLHCEAVPVVLEQDVAMTPLVVDHGLGHQKAPSNRRPPAQVSPRAADDRVATDSNWRATRDLHAKQSLLRRGSARVARTAQNRLRPQPAGELAEGAAG